MPGAVGTDTITLVWVNGRVSAASWAAYARARSNSAEKCPMALSY